MNFSNLFFNLKTQTFFNLEDIFFNLFLLSNSGIISTKKLGKSCFVSYSVIIGVQSEKLGLPGLHSVFTDTFFVTVSKILKSILENLVSMVFFFRAQNNLRVDQTAVCSPIRRIPRHPPSWLMLAPRCLQEMVKLPSSCRLDSGQRKLRNRASLILLFRSSMKDIIALKPKSTTLETALRERFACN